MVLAVVSRTLTALDKFVRTTLGDGFAAKYEIIIDGPIALAQAMRESADLVLRYRDEIKDAPYFNWSLTIDKRYQQPFQPSHEAMSKLELNRQLTAHELAGNLRRAFSGGLPGM